MFRRHLSQPQEALRQDLKLNKQHNKQTAQAINIMLLYSCS